MATQYLRKEKVIAVVTTDDDGNVVSVEHRVHDSISQSKRASRDIGLGVIRNVDRLPQATA
jgi:hypothetical protein